MVFCIKTAYIYGLLFYHATLVFIVFSILYQFLQYQSQVIWPILSTSVSSNASWVLITKESVKHHGVHLYSSWLRWSTILFWITSLVPMQGLAVLIRLSRRERDRTYFLGLSLGSTFHLNWNIEPNLQYLDDVSCQRPLCELAGAPFPVLALKVMSVNPERVSLNQELLAIICFTTSVPNWLVFRWHHALSWPAVVNNYDSCSICYYWNIFIKKPPWTFSYEKNVNIKN